MTKLIDLSHTIEHGMVTYRGLPAPIICDYLSREDSRRMYAEGTEFSIPKIEMVSNTGTYLDSPFHRYADGKDLSQLELTSLADLPGLVIRVKPDGNRAILPEILNGLDLAGKAVLFHTGWARHWRTETYYGGHPFLPAETAQRLVEVGVTLVGIDSYNIDNTDGGERPAHSLLLGAEIPIVEHMRGLEELPDSGFKFFAVPVKVKNFGTFPVRAFAIIED